MNKMYAIIVTGGKQYRVEQGDIVYIEKLDVEADSEVKFDQVLAIGEEGSVLVAYTLGLVVWLRALPCALALCADRILVCIVFALSPRELCLQRLSGFLFFHRRPKAFTK